MYVKRVGAELYQQHTTFSQTVAVTRTRRCQQGWKLCLKAKAGDFGLKIMAKD